MPAGRHTAADLIRHAADWGYDASERMLRRWVAAGLMDRPALGRGLGRGQGRAQRAWSDSQLTLWRLLLWLHSRSAYTRHARLCDLPVWVWLRGDDATVPLPQVRRALATWAKGPRHSSRAAAERDAVLVVGHLAEPGREDRAVKRLRRGVADLFEADFAYRAQASNEELLIALRAVMEPPGSSSSDGAASLGPEGVLEVLLAMADPRVAFDRLDGDAFARARVEWAAARAAPGMLRVAEWLTDPGFLALEGPRAPVMDGSCLDLRMALAEVTRSRGSDVGGLGEDNSSDN